MKNMKTLYWLITTPMLAIFLYRSGLAFFDYETLTDNYLRLEFPVWTIIPTAILEVLGVMAIVSRLSIKLTEWAYIGFLFESIFATSANVISNDSFGAILSGVALGLTLVSLLIFTVHVGKKEQAK